MNPGMAFYGELPDSYNMVVNVKSSVVDKIRKEANESLMPMLRPINEEIESRNTKISDIRKAAGDKPSDEQNKEITTLNEEITHQRHQYDKAVREYAVSHKLVKQSIDLALLANGLLRGQELNEFIRRSVELL